MSYWGLIDEAALVELMNGSTTAAIVQGTEQYVAAEFGRQAFDFDGSTLARLPAILQLEGDVSVFFRVKAPAPATLKIPFGYRNGSDITAIGYRGELTPDRWRCQRNFINITDGNYIATLSGEWQAKCWVSATDSFSVYDSDTLEAATNGSFNGTFKLQEIGGMASPSWIGAIGDLVAINRVATSADRIDYATGPEPKDVAGTLAENGAYTLTATDPNNGAISWEWVLAEPDGTAVVQGTGASGTIDLSAVADGTYYLLARASNLGGYIEGDYATRTSGYGAADDGYHEAASVVVAQSVFTGLRVHEITRPNAAHITTRRLNAHAVARPVLVHSVESE